MNRFLLTTTMAFAIMVSFSLNVEAQIDEGIRLMVENVNAPLDSQTLYCKKLLPELYFKNEFKKLWNNPEHVKQLIERLKQASEDGLLSEDYHYSYLAEHYNAANPISDELDILMTDAYLLFASHLLSGKVNPEQIEAEWQVNRKEMDFQAHLIDALEKGTISQSLLDLRPKHQAYHKLKQTLKNYRAKQYDGGWPTIPPGETIKPGQSDERIPIIRQRLSVYTNGNKKDSINTYDNQLLEAVKHFQKGNGLEADGNIGKETISTMNISVEERISQILINMERYRWLPQHLGDHYILVNIANYQLEIIKNGKLELEMDVVVGKPFRKTPVFSESLRYMVLNPYWTVPPTILEKDVLPAIKKNTGYLKSQNMKIIAGSTEVDPHQIQWSNVTARSFPYQIRQDPGPNNALGVVKFIFPNRYNVYMHDTNHRELFSKTDRALSSGCIRLAHPLDLAEYILKNQPIPWTREKINKLVREEKNYTVLIQQNINVHLLYWTAFVDNQGNLNFRKDIYERDAPLKKALLDGPPSVR